jgi:cell division septum initiation protein DivIVA
MRQDIDVHLVALRDLVANARTMPMSSSAVINRAELTALIDDLDAAIERTLGHAATVVDKADEVVEASRDEAEELLRQAQNEREALVSDTDVYKLAQQRADEMTASAQRGAEELRRETDAYVEENLANFELTLERTLEAVRRGRARLMGGVVHGLADDSDVDDIQLPDHLA